MLTSSEIESELQNLLSNTTHLFDVGAYCFDAQRPFATSRAKWVTASCSRRSGKTEGAACLAIDAMQTTEHGVVLYITDSRVNAKRIFWSTLKRVAKETDLGAVAHEGELKLEMPNGSVCYLLGVHDKDAIDKVRGLPILLAILDEAQLLKNLKALIEESLEPAMMDFDGRVVLCGTPGPVPVGYFWECINNPEWEHFSWTVFDNPHILRKSRKTPQQQLEATLRRRGVTVEHPSIQREWFGRWVYDPNALVFSYSEKLNDYDALPDLKAGGWEYGISGDIGWDDADALGVLAWHPSKPDLWLIHEDVMPKQTISQLGDKLKGLVQKYSPLFVVLDFGGLGKKIAEELTSRWDLKVEAAEKERKLEHIELLNDAMRTGTFHAKKETRFAQDSMLVEWDKSNPEKPKISERFHSDACDMVLYGFRRALQWHHVAPPPPAPPKNTPEWVEAQRAKINADAEAEMERESELLEREKQERTESVGESMEDWL